MKNNFKIILILFLCVISNHLRGEDPYLHFKKISTDAGLPDNRVKCILQDSLGFMWFGTLNGLVRYDGYNFKYFQSDPADSNSLSENTVFSLCQDDNDNLWIGTFHGLNRYSLTTNKFTQFIHQKSDRLGLTNSEIICLHKDKFNRIWIGTSHGLSIYDTSLESFIWPFSEEYTNTLQNLRIETIYEDKDAFIWISTVTTDGKSGGIFRIKSGSEIIEYLNLNFQENNLILRPVIYKIYEDSQGNFWFGTDAGFGLFIDSLSVIKSRISKPASIKSTGLPFITSIIEGFDNTLWIGTSIAGLYHFDPKNNRVEQYQYISDIGSSLSDNKVTSLYLDPGGNLWVATWGGGINKVNLRERRFRNIPLALSNAKPFQIQTIYQYPKGIFWLGTRENGLIKYDMHRNSIKSFTPGNSYEGILSNWVRYIFVDKKGMIWLGLIGGAQKFDPQTEIFHTTKRPRLDNELSHKSYVHQFCQDSENYIWAAYNKGLCKIDPDRNEVLNTFLIDETDPADQITNGITTMCLESDSVLWVGTYSGVKKFNPITEKFDINHHLADSIHYGLIRYLYIDSRDNLWIGTAHGVKKLDRKLDKIFSYGQNEGMKSNLIHAIAEDNNGDIWISTNRGIARYQPDLNEIRTYDDKDGIGGNQFHMRAVYKSENGEIFFGGEGGLTIIESRSIEQITYHPPLVMTDLDIPNNDASFDTVISYKQKIFLPFDSNFFDLSFAALDYTNPGNIMYRYRMPDLVNNWIYTKIPRVSFTNIPPGKYLFHVEGTNRDGIWSRDKIDLQIIIDPPWWKTYFAYSIYFLIFIVLLTVAWRARIKRLKIMHSFELEHTQAEKLKEIDAIKSSFFANISHEFRTPLSLIKAPVQQMLRGELKGNFKSHWIMILKYTDQLLNLVNQLLDLTKLDSGKMELKCQIIDLESLMAELVHIFSSSAEQKNITLSLYAGKQCTSVYLDIQKFEQIINNLLSNALKYTPADGRIEVGFISSETRLKKEISAIKRIEYASEVHLPDTNKKYVIIYIKNTGPGIAKDDLVHIFDRFYQSSDHQAGSGLGLSLVKQLVELHHGQIFVSSIPDKETIFTICLPSGKSHLNPDQIVAEKEIRSFELDQPTYKSTEINFNNSNDPQKYNVLIVDDHQDVRKFIRKNLEDVYNIFEAENGDSGYKCTLSAKVDLIISDVMMPVSDGYELCRKIKSDEETSHIPVILLTARADHDSKLSGLETGADQYLVKPFDIAELRAQIKNLIDQRNLLREKYIAELSLNTLNSSAISMNDRFMLILKEEIEKSIANPGFSITELAKRLNLSRASLYRKVQALTGITPVLLIRMIRLNKAASLLKSNSGNVTQTAYDVGFSSVSYFSKSFERQFGMSPSEYIKQHHQ